MPVTKKTTAKKTVTKKTATAKTKKTVTAKAKTTAKKTVVPKTTEISVTGNKKIGTLQKEFNKKFPYIRLSIFYSYARRQVAKGETIYNIPEDKALASVRRADSGGDISISGNRKVKSLEAEFDKVFGLYAQICYTTGEGNRHYTSSFDEMTLSALNTYGEKNGWKKGEYK